MKNINGIKYNGSRRTFYPNVETPAADGTITGHINYCNKQITGTVKAVNDTFVFTKTGVVTPVVASAITGTPVTEPVTAAV